MYTKADFTDAIKNTIENYPAIAALYRAGDPRILQNLEAQATMLAMLSSQLEVAMAEPFEKVRDATVLADASMRGIIRKARPGKVTVTVTNKGTTPFIIASSRVILDSMGNSYVVDAPVTIPAATSNGSGSGSGSLTATQVKTETIIHAVTGSAPFYAIEIPESTDGSYLSGIAVSDSEGDYEYRERYVNTLMDERVFHVETDDKQRVYVRFGQFGVVAYQPVDGTMITLTLFRSIGVLTLTAGSPFSFDYISSPQESLIDLTLSATDTILDPGENPPDMATLRDLIKYPSVYDHNAVYLGEFEFLVRRAYPDLQFLSIWNETIEETARGVNINNINTLFVACKSNNAENPEQVLTAPSSIALIPSAELTPIQTSIQSTIKAADDSYRVKFYTPVISKIQMSVTATISTAYISTEVVTQIKTAILDEFGIKAPASKRGSSKPLYQQIYALLRKKIPALSDNNSDWTVSIIPTTGAYKPELWRYVSDESLTVSVTAENTNTSGWI